MDFYTVTSVFYYLKLRLPGNQKVTLLNCVMDTTKIHMNRQTEIDDFTIQNILQYRMFHLNLISNTSDIST